MSELNLDHIEAVARAAQERTPGQWTQGAAHDEDPCAVYAPQADTAEAYFVADTHSQRIAEYIATCSPDVVLALVARVRELERRYEFDVDSGEHDDACMARIGKRGGYWDCDCGAWR